MARSEPEEAAPHLDPGVPTQQESPAAPGAARRILRNAASMVIGDAGGEALTGIAIVLAAVSLGRAGFGQLVEAQAFVEPFEALAGLGLGTVAITMAARRGGCDGTLRGTILGIRMISGLVTAGIVLAAAFVTGRWYLLPLLLALSANLLVTPVSVVAILPFQYEQAVHKRIAVPSILGVFRVGTAYLAKWLLNRPIGFQLSGLSTGILAALINVGWARRFYPAKFRFDRKLAIQLISMTWPATVLEFVVVAYMRASYFLLHDAGPVVQGEYAAADRLVRPVLALGGALFLSSLPTIAALAAGREFVSLKRLYARSVARVTLALIPIGSAAWFLAPWLLRRFVPEYAGAIWPFRILIVGTFFMFLNQLSSTFIVALGKFRVIMTVAIFNLVVYLGLASVLVDRYKAVGAAAATSTMEAVNTLIQLGVVVWLLRVARKEHERSSSPPSKESP